MEIEHGTMGGAALGLRPPYQRCRCKIAMKRCDPRLPVLIGAGAKIGLLAVVPERGRPYARHVQRALAAWRPPLCRSRGRSWSRPLPCANIAIETVPLLAALDLPLREAEGFARSILTLMDLDLPVPDQKILARRRRTVCFDMQAPARTSIARRAVGDWAHRTRGKAATG